MEGQSGLSMKWGIWADRIEVVDVNEEAGYNRIGDQPARLADGEKGRGCSLTYSQCD